MNEAHSSQKSLRSHFKLPEEREKNLISGFFGREMIIVPTLLLGTRLGGLRSQWGGMQIRRAEAQVYYKQFKKGEAARPSGCSAAESRRGKVIWRNPISLQVFV